MQRVIRSRISICILTFLLSISTGAFASVTTQTGTLSDGATYLIEVPSPWNGTLLLYSHDYVVPGNPNPALDVGDSTTGSYLLSNGFALAGSSYAHTGWAIQEAFVDQTAVLDAFNASFGTPIRTIAWGHGLGAMITAGLMERFPARFNGALPMCGELAGTVGGFNRGLNAAFTFKTILASNTALQVVNITDPTSNLNLAEQILATNQSTEKGRARLSLVFAMGDSPGWFDPSSPEPAATDYVARQANQFQWAKNFIFPVIFGLRAELEARAGGNGSWNDNIDYNVQFSKSIDQAEVTALYSQAGLNLNADLKALNNAPRITADPTALQYLEQNTFYNGGITSPVLTLHTTADGEMDVEQESAYLDVVREANNTSLLSQIYVHRAGHGAFSPAETITALQNLIQRLDTGAWPNLDQSVLNAQATALGSSLNTMPPSFFNFTPAEFLRPFDAFDASKCTASSGILLAPTASAVQGPTGSIIEIPPGTCP
jgi:hypothetical protein